MINGIETRFSQETLNLIDSVSNSLKLNIENIADTFNLSFDQLNAEIKIFSQIHDIPKRK